MANIMRFGGGVGGGSGAEYIVETSAGATVTATLGTSVVTAIAGSDGKATLKLNKAGTWSIVATLNGIKSPIKTYHAPPIIELPVPRPVANTSATAGVVYTNGLAGVTADLMALYAEAISNNSAISRTTSVVYLDFGSDGRKLTIGDTMSFSINNTTVQARLISFNTDTLADAAAYGSETATGKCGMTFDTVTTVSTAPMNNSPTNAGGWNASLMRTSTMATLLGTIPPAWKAALKARSLTSKTNTNANQQTTDTLAIHNQSDVGSSGYNWYAAGNSKIKNNASGSVEGWWLRDAVSDPTTNFYFVNASGSIATTFASFSRDVVPSFAF